MDLFRPAEKKSDAAILFMVSGGWFSKWAPPEATRNPFSFLLDEGYTVFAVRHGSSPRYSIPEIVTDVRNAVKFVRTNADKFAIDADRLGVLGMSAGGHLSLMLATTGNDTVDGERDKTSASVRGRRRPRSSDRSARDGLGSARVAAGVPPLSGVGPIARSRGDAFTRYPCDRR